MRIKIVQKIIDSLRGKKSKNVFDYGKNNKVSFVADKSSKKIKIHIYGDNNQIEIKTTERCIMDIFIGLCDCPVNNCKIAIGERTSIAGMEVRMCEDNLEMSIGKDCMISDYIKVFCSDMHTIYNDDGEILNRGNVLKIGDHVWIGTGVYIAKKTVIADKCIVGMRSVVAGKFTESNSVIAGNPARLVKQHINWDRLPIKRFEKDSKGKKCA